METDAVFDGLYTEAEKRIKLTCLAQCRRCERLAKHIWKHGTLLR